MCILMSVREGTSGLELEAHILVLSGRGTVLRLLDAASAQYQGSDRSFRLCLDATSAHYLLEFASTSPATPHEHLPSTEQHSLAAFDHILFVLNLDLETLYCLITKLVTITLRISVSAPIGCDVTRSTPILSTSRSPYHVLSTTYRTCSAEAATSSSLARWQRLLLSHAGCLRKL